MKCGVFFISLFVEFFFFGIISVNFDEYLVVGGCGLEVFDHVNV